MGHQKLISITTNKQSYVGGENVQGVVTLALPTQKIVKDVTLKLKGCEKTKTHEILTGDGGVETKQYKDKKEFFKQKIVLAAPRGPMAAGTYQWPFEYALPPDLPGAYKEHGSYGGYPYDANIAYTINCQVDIEGYNAKDIEQKTKLVVHERFMSSAKPLHEEGTKKFMFGSGKLKLAADLPKNWYYPGESVGVQVIVNNEASKDVDQLKIKLYRHLEVRCEHHCFIIDGEVHRETYPGVESKCSLDQVFTWVVPKTQPSTSGRLIRCSHRIEVECDVAMAKDLELHFPVTIVMPMQPDPLYY